MMLQLCILEYVNVGVCSMYMYMRIYAYVYIYIHTLNGVLFILCDVRCLEVSMMICE